MNEQLDFARSDKACVARSFAKQIRRHALRMTHAAKASHIGGCLSAADILAVLYSAVLRVDPQRPSWLERDRFILSKGHTAAALYGALAEKGFFPAAWLDEYCKNGARLAGHVTHDGVPGVDFSTGSLGHGLSLGCGCALAARADGSPRRVFVVLSDGECDEGSTWEAALFAGHHRLGELIAIIDHNKVQSFGTVPEVLDLHPFAAKWQACRWAVEEVDGHNVDHLLVAFDSALKRRDQPTVILAHTIKGRGVGFMENELLWHYRNVNDEQLSRALAEVDAMP